MISELPSPLCLFPHLTHKTIRQQVISSLNSEMLLGTVEVKLHRENELTSLAVIHSYYSDLGVWMASFILEGKRW